MTYLNEEEIAKKRIFQRYKYVLKGLGVDLNDPDVVEILNQSYFNFEPILQQFIVWMLWREKKDGELPKYPNSALIKAFKEEWKAGEQNYWSDKIFEDPRFQSPGIKWWNKAGKYLGENVRNQIVADIVEDVPQPYILFYNNSQLPLRCVERMSWEEIKKYPEERKYFF